MPRSSRSLALAALLLAAVLVAGGAVSAAPPQPAEGLRVQEGRLFCPPYACSGFLPEAEAFRRAEGLDLPVVEALKGGEVFAYVFLSADLVDIPGYSGKPLVTLIAMDPDGVLLKAKVVYHNEPILLVGIPESVLDEYLGHLVGRSVLAAQPAVPPQAKPVQMVQPPPQAVQVHMITGATVTALVLDDTVLTSARDVARAIGLIREGGQRKVTWRADYVEKGWDELLAEGSIGHLRVLAEEMGLEAPDGRPYIELFFGDVTQPVVGVNILGRSTYDWMQGQLKPGQHAFFIVGRGTESFKGSGFVRGGIFDRFHFEQGLKQFSFKDLDYENLYGVKAAGAPKFRESGLFFLRDRTFDPTLPWSFVFLAQRLTGETARSKEFRTFRAEYHLPEKYYTVEVTAAPERTSVVRTAWSQKWPDVVLLALLLLAAAGAFLARRWTTGSARRLEAVHVSIMVASVVVLGVVLKTPLSVTQLFPFVRAFEDGFRWGLFLSDPLLFVFWAAVAVSLLLWGRGWFCGWLCPYGAMLELIHRVSRRVLPARWLFEFPQRVHDVLRRVRYVIFLGLLALAVFSLEWAERLAEVEPFKTTWLVGVFNREWYLALYWWVLLVASVFTFRFFCRYLCPLGAALSIGSALRLIGIRRKEFCTICKICAKGCDSRAIDDQGRINRYECLYCMECEQKYHDDQVCPPLIVARRKGEEVARDYVRRNLAAAGVTPIDAASRRQAGGGR